MSRYRSQNGEHWTPRKVCRVAAVSECGNFFAEWVGSSSSRFLAPIFLCSLVFVVFVIALHSRERESAVSFFFFPHARKAMELSLFLFVRMSDLFKKI